LLGVSGQSGYHVVNFKSFPTEIKGGYANSTVRISDEKLYSTGDGFDILCFLTLKLTLTTKSI